MADSLYRSLHSEQVDISNTDIVSCGEADGGEGIIVTWIVSEDKQILQDTMLFLLKVNT